MTREEAIKEIKKAMPYMWKETKEAIGVLVPEFTESEDERIRKHLIEIVEIYWGKTNEPGKAADLAWLEKQKEQKPRDYRKLYEDIAQSEWFKKSYVGKSLGEEFEQKPTESEDERIRKAIIHYILYETKGTISEATEHTWVKWLEKQKEQKPEWSEADEVYLEDALWCVEKAEKSCKDDEDKGACWSAKRWLKSLSGRLNLQPKNEWSEEDEKQIRQIERIVKDAGCSQKLQEQIHNWFKSLRPQPRQEWDEFDEDCLKRAIWYVENPAPSVVKDTNLALWLKSLPTKIK